MTLEVVKVGGGEVDLMTASVTRLNITRWRGWMC